MHRKCLVSGRAIENALRYQLALRSTGHDGTRVSASRASTSIIGLVGVVAIAVCCLTANPFSKFGYYL